MKRMSAPEFSFLGLGLVFGSHESLRPWPGFFPVLRGFAELRGSGRDFHEDGAQRV